MCKVYDTSWGLIKSGSHKRDPDLEKYEMVVLHKSVGILLPVSRNFGTSFLTTQTKAPQQEYDSIPSSSKELVGALLPCPDRDLETHKKRKRRFYE